MAEVQIFVVTAQSREEAQHQVRLLLRQGLAQWGLPGDFGRLEKDERGKPYLVPTQALPAPPDVSLSHAPGLTVLALGLHCRVGVDAEPLSTAFPPPMYARLFSPAELAAPLADPVHLWARKEAVLKADGRGMTQDLAQLDVLGDAVDFDGTVWHLHKVDAGAGHACWLACNVSEAQVRLLTQSTAPIIRNRRD